MTRNSSDACWSSDDSSFGWVDMEDTEPAAAKKASAVVERTSNTEDDSSDDSDLTQFEPKCKNKSVHNAEREQNQNVKRNELQSTKISRGQVKSDISEDSDSTQFDGELDNTPVAKDAIRSKGNNPLTVKTDQLKSPRTTNANTHEPSENGESESESSDSSDKKDLKRFTKKLLVKKERHSHALSDESDIDSPPLKPRLRIEAESETTKRKTKEDKHATLIEGVLLDTVQPLPFDIGANEDVWIVQCPNEVSELTLKGKTFNFNGISCAEQFEGRVVLTANPKPVNLLLPKSPQKLKSITPMGHIIFREKEIAPHTLHPVCNEDNITSLPTGLKERHPLFGTDLSLVQRLSSHMQKRKKKKKKKHNVYDLGSTFCKDETEEMEAENIAKFSNNLDASPVRDKKKKKSKLLDEQTVTFSQDSGVKKHNLQLSSFHSGSSPKITGEKTRNGFVNNDCVPSELQQKKHRKVKQEPGEADSPEIKNVHPELAYATQSKKRKHKHLENSFESDRKHEPGEADSPEIKNIHRELDYATQSKKRKHKHLENSFESDRQMARGISDGAESTLSQKRKKLKYDNESITSSDVYYTSKRTVVPSESFADGSDLTLTKKKKHQKYERDFQNEIVNNKLDELDIYSQDITLDPVTDGFLHTVKKKKKKIKESDTEFRVTSNIKTSSDINCMSIKKKKKLKLENSDEHVEQLWLDSGDTENNVCDVTCASLDYFDVNRKKIHKEERRKFAETEHSPEFSEEKFSNSLLKEESSYVDYSPLTDVYQKKKKKRKSE